jgi:hypothetical protein
MLGGEFLGHGSQQEARVKVVDANFPGLQGLSEDFILSEECYSLKNFSKDNHVLLVLVVEQHLRFFQIEYIVPFSEPSVDRSEKLAGYGDGNRGADVPLLWTSSQIHRQTLFLLRTPILTDRAL